MCCLACIEIASGKADYSTVIMEFNKIPEGFAHKAEVEKLIKQHFQGPKEVIRLETLRTLANKYNMKRK